MADKKDDLPTEVSYADAVPDEPLSGRQKLRLVGLVILKRLRFLVILAAVGLFIGYWETIKNYWDKYTRPSHAAVRQLAADEEFYCPMDPQVVRSDYEPNGDVPKCPICGMPLSIRKKGEALKLPAGVTGRVQLSPERIQLAGVKTAEVEYRPMFREVRTVGYVAYDESRLSRVVSRVQGYIEKLYVDKTFTVVRKGDPLAEIYSPELYSAAQELVLAKQTPAIGDLVASVRKKLQLLGVEPQEIAAIESSGQAATRLVIRSPQTGYVVAKNVVEGASVDARMTLLEVADLATVWIEADVYEKDIPFLQVGQKVEATLEAAPARVFTGKVALIYPQLEPTTRTNRIRFELENPENELRPGMFATARIQTPLESIEPYASAARTAGRVVLTGMGAERPAYEFLVVPERAVIDTGSKKIVYVEREPGMFEGVEVQLGPRNGDHYPVLSGLKAGDKIAAAGGFLIDAETRLNPAAASTYFGASGGPQSRGSAPAMQVPQHGEHSAAAPPQAEAKEAEPAMSQAEPVELTPDDIENINQLPEEDRKLALAQRACPVTGAALGSMGVPVKVTLRGQTVLLCCKGCMGKAKREPDGTLTKVEELKKAK